MNNNETKWSYPKAFHTNSGLLKAKNAMRSNNQLIISFLKMLTFKYGSYFKIVESCLGPKASPIQLTCHRVGKEALSHSPHNIPQVVATFLWQWSYLENHTALFSKYKNTFIWHQNVHLNVWHNSKYFCQRPLDSLTKSQGATPNVTPKEFCSPKKLHPGGGDNKLNWPTSWPLEFLHHGSFICGPILFLKRYSTTMISLCMA